MKSVTEIETPQDGDQQTPPTTSFVLVNDAVPLYVDPDGAVRVTGTRVLLEIVVGAFEQGDTPEEIVASFPTLQLADVYAVIAYYLRHQDAVKAYIQWVAEEAEKIRQQIETYQNSAEFRDRMATRRAAQRG
jgi:uncharacterized protein (DUF433 family)